MVILTKSQVRSVCGVGTDIVDDTTLDAIISEIESKTINYFGVYTTPKKVIEILDGNNRSSIMVNKPYILKILELKIKDTSLDLSNILIKPKSSIIEIDNTQNPYIFSAYPNGIKVKYLSAFMEFDRDNLTETTTAVESGSDVIIEVDDESLFSANDWVMIEGTDGKREIAQVTGVSADNSTITVDLLVQDHIAESLVTLMKTEESLVQFLLYETGLTTAITAVGGSYNFATGYTFPEYSVQKGVPYQHFVKAIDDLEKQRNLAKIKVWNKLNPIA